MIVDKFFENYFMNSPQESPSLRIHLPESDAIMVLTKKTELGTIVFISPL